MLERDFNDGLLGGAAPHVRFPIYRNNVTQALVGALRVRFPVVEQLVGQAFFSSMAGAYVAANKPASAVLIQYGASFAEYIEGFEAAATLPYLADVARFENAWWHAYHAYEAVPLATIALAEIAPEDLGGLKFQFHPSFQMIQNSNAAASIWQWHQIANNPAKLEEPPQEFAIVWRPNADVHVRLIAADGFCFFEVLKSGADLESALLGTIGQFPEFDLQSNLAALFQLELIVKVTK